MDINPMANVVDAWRWMLFPGQVFNKFTMINFAVVILVCLGGMFFNNKKESEFSDYV